jgi:uncharacterized phiE125 gp8 family phage protein
MIGSAPVRTVAPTALPVTLAELKAQLRFFESNEDAIMMAHLRSATEEVENYTSMGLLPQTWQQTFPEFPSIVPPIKTWPLKLYRRPLRAVVSVEYLDSSGLGQILSDSVYRVSGAGQPWHASTIALNTGQSWPTVYYAHEAITVTYEVGFDDHNAVPEIIRDAILLRASTKFQFREEIVMGSVTELSMNIKAMLRDYRPIAVA